MNSVYNSLFLFLLSCSEPDPIISEWKKDADDLKKQCESENVAELKTLCWLRAAIQHAKQEKVEAFKSTTHRVAT